MGIVSSAKRILAYCTAARDCVSIPDGDSFLREERLPQGTLASSPVSIPDGDSFLREAMHFGSCDFLILFQSPMGIVSSAKSIEIWLKIPLIFVSIPDGDSFLREVAKPSLASPRDACFNPRWG